MACPRCGEVCHCYAEVRVTNGGLQRPKFEVDAEKSAPVSSAVLIDPESYDATEEQFSASLETSTTSRGRFVPDSAAENTASEPPSVSSRPELSLDYQSGCEPASENARIPAVEREGGVERQEAAISATCTPAADGVEPNPRSTEVESPGDANPDAWKDEVAARLNSYRARRKPKPPKYPSLSLNFESPSVRPEARTLHHPDSGRALAVDQTQPVQVENRVQQVRVLPAEEVPPAALQVGRLIEFPRFFSPEEVPLDQLAEPVCEQPRILDAPEVELPAPALGGIVLETRQELETEARPGFEVPLYSARIARRLLAAAIDLVVIAAAGAVFGYIFLKLTKVIPPLPQLLTAATLVTMVLWAGYQYLLLTYAGATPGLRLTKLRLVHFDGSAVLRSTRRWRVLASILSGLSLGLGFAWCFLDEDALCWHDRITRTHLVPSR
ncbi:MAG TPA: RDD family protein [Terriglobales bacterium]